MDSCSEPNCHEAPTNICTSCERQRCPDHIRTHNGDSFCQSDRLDEMNRRYAYTSCDWPVIEALISARPEEK